MQIYHIPAGPNAPKMNFVLLSDVQKLIAELERFIASAPPAPQSPPARQTERES
jgi:hypothetical protein